MLEHASVKGRHVVVAWGTQCKATYIDIDNSYMNSDQKEAQLIQNCYYKLLMRPPVVQ